MVYLHTSRHLMRRAVAATRPCRMSFATDSKQQLSTPKLQSIFDRVTALPEEELNILRHLTLQVLGTQVYPGEFGGGGGAADAAAVVEEVVEEKTAFDVKLVGYDAKAKIKIIKEVRALGGLGLKEAKAMVDGVPKVIQKGLKKDKADEIKETLEALGGEIEIV